jgi:hypothetical protein
VEDFDNIIGRTNVKTFQQVFVVWFLLILPLFLEYVCNPELVDDYVRLFILLCLLWDVNKKSYQKLFSQKGKRRCEAAFFKDTSNYFSLLNLKSLIERFGSLRNLWGREWEKFIKYVKAEMNTICDTETFMSSVLNNLLCTHCLDNSMKNNQ